MSEEITADHEPPTRLSDDERAELAWLRTQNKYLQVQRDVLVRIASGYARDMERMLGRPGEDSGEQAIHYGQQKPAMSTEDTSRVTTAEP